MPLNNWRKSWSKKRGEKGVRERERGSGSESDFPSPVSRSSDSFVAGSLSSRLWLPECIRGPVCNLTSQYWNSNASSHSINCCLVIGFQTCGAGILDVLASLIMLCHGGWRKSSNFVKLKEKKIVQIMLWGFHPFIRCGPSRFLLSIRDTRQHSTCYALTLLHMHTHLCRAHSAPSALLFLLVQLQLLAHLNNSVRVRISISYSILNMPKKSRQTRDRRAPASIRSFVTDNRATNSFCYNAHCIVIHQFCTWLFPPLLSCYLFR